MPALSINPLIIIYGVLAAAGIAVMVWTFDAIGDQREAKVWRQINSAVEQRNVKVRKQNDADDIIAAVTEAARKKALEELPKSDQCPPATEAQAKALSKIK